MSELSPLQRAVRSGGVVWAVVAAVVVIAWTGSEQFATSANLTNLSRQAIVLSLVSLAQFIVVLVAGVDLSLGASVRLTSIAAAMTMQGTDDRLLAGLAVAVVLGAVIGLFNGLVVTKLRVEPFIATLGSGALVSGIALYVAATPKGRVSPWLAELYSQRLWFDAYTITVLVAIAWLVAWLALNRLRWGRHTYAVGGAAEVAQLSGLAVDRVRVSAYVLAGVLGGLAGLVTLAGSGIGDPAAATGLEFTTLAVVVIGGASLAGGQGRLVGVLGGVMLFALLGNVFTLLRVEVWYQQGIRGLIILIAASLYVQRRRRVIPATRDTTPAVSTT